MPKGGTEISVRPENSKTVPCAVTRSPTATVDALPVNTNTPSDVEGSPSSSDGIAVWTKKPLLLSAVTTPRTAAS